MTRVLGRSAGLLACSFFILPAAAADFRPAAYGAKADGKSPNTSALQKTIDAAARVHGTVVIPAGTYRTGALFLKSGIEFRLEKGAILVGAQELAAYPMMPTRVAGIEMA